MKVNTLSRVESRYKKERAGGLDRVMRNPDPELHPLEKAREYTRALKATKLERMFAKPFVGALDGHTDAVYRMATSRQSLAAFLTGACDGEIKLWDLPRQRCVKSLHAHAGYVRGLAVSHDGRHFFSCGDDKNIKQHRMSLVIRSSGSRAASRGGKSQKGGGGGEPSDESESEDSEDEDDADAAVATWHGKEPFMDLDHHWREPLFATAGTSIHVWDHTRSDPVHTYSWGADTIQCVRFNPAEPCLIGSTASDRNVCLYDTRGSTPVRKLVMGMRSNALAWNPMEPFNFTVANEDHNCYTFDMRRLQSALMVHRDHVSAVMDVAYSPTGREFVTGSYDRTVRIYNVRSGRSREVYHTRRMQRVFSVKFSQDARFVVSGSDDTNVRVWKARASEKLGRLLPRERAAMNYNEKLKKRFEQVDEVKRIARHRRVPHAIKNAKEREHSMDQARRLRVANMKRHRDPKGEQLPVRKRAIVAEEK